jgi:hypothetical protein
MGRANGWIGLSDVESAARSPGRMYMVLSLLDCVVNKGTKVELCELSSIQVSKWANILKVDRKLSCNRDSKSRPAMK